MGGTHTSTISKKENGLSHFPKSCFFKWFWKFLDYSECPGVSKDKSCWFWGSWTRPKIPKAQRNEGGEGSHISKSNSYKFRLERNNTTELLSISFQLIYHTHCPNIAKSVKRDVFSGFCSGSSIGDHGWKAHDGHVLASLGIPSVML